MTIASLVWATDIDVLPVDRIVERRDGYVSSSPAAGPGFRPWIPRRPTSGRGICSRLVVEAARDAAEHWSVRQFAIVAAADYHALGLYESLGFQARERVAGACRRPPS